ncbi:MAG: hypothetical protein WA324_21350 [Bryobacteraceae bacterium]
MKRSDMWQFGRRISLPGLTGVAGNVSVTVLFAATLPVSPSRRRLKPQASPPQQPRSRRLYRYAIGGERGSCENHVSRYRLQT